VEPGAVGAAARWWRWLKTRRQTWSRWVVRSEMASFHPTRAARLDVIFDVCREVVVVGWRADDQETRIFGLVPQRAAVEHPRRSIRSGSGSALATLHGCTGVGTGCVFSRWD
jgi:hypothetical protein